jgi:hypothetical protein
VLHFISEFYGIVLILGNETSFSIFMVCLLLLKNNLYPEQTSFKMWYCLHRMWTYSAKHLWIGKREYIKISQLSAVSHFETSLSVSSTQQGAYFSCEISVTWQTGTKPFLNCDKVKSTVDGLRLPHSRVVLNRGI